MCLSEMAHAEEAAALKEELPSEDDQHAEEQPRVLVSPTAKGHEDGHFDHADDSATNIDHAMPSKVYAAKGVSKAEIEKRHQKFGYDPLDKALMEQREQFELKKSLKSKITPGFMKKTRTPQEEYEHNVKRLLRDHLDTMESLGIAFHHDFVNERLGFSILLARYGTEGRKFVQVDETFPHSESYPEPLKPTDELIAVNGKLILNPEEGQKFKLLQDTISKAKRPLRLTFIHGERREEAFFEQETRREFTSEDRPSVQPSPLCASSAKHCERALAKLDALKAAALDGSAELADESIGAIEAALMAVRENNEEAQARIGDDRYTRSVAEVAETKAIVAANATKTQAVAEEARVVFADLCAKLDREKAHIDEAERFATKAKVAREATEAASERGDVRTAEQGVENAVEAEQGAAAIVALVDEPERDCFVRTKAAVAESARFATDERQRAQAARYLAVAAAARKRAENAATRALDDDAQQQPDGSEVPREEETDGACDDVDDALSRVMDLLNRVKTDPKVSDETMRRVEMAAKKIAGDRHVAESAKHVAASSAARLAAEQAAEKGEVDDADAAAARAAAADEAHCALQERAATDGLSEEDAASLETGARKATEQHELAQAAAWAARAAMPRQGEGDDDGAVDDALSRVRGLLNRVRNNSGASEAHVAAIAAYARSAIDKRHIADSQNYAAVAAAARIEAQKAAENGNADKASEEADKAKQAAAAATALRTRVFQDAESAQTTRVAVAEMQQSAEGDDRVAETAKWAAATAAARQRAEDAADSGDVVKATEAADEARDTEGKASSLLASATSLSGDSTSADDDGKLRAAALADVRKHAQVAKEERMLAESASHLAGVRSARERAEAAAAAGDEKMAETCAKGAGNAEANVLDLVAAVEHDEACSFETKTAIATAAKAAGDERVLADAAKLAASAAAAKVRAEEAAIGGDGEAATAAADNAAKAEAGVSELLVKVEADSTVGAKLTLIKRKATDDRQAAEAAKFIAMAASSRRAAEQAADEGQVDAAEQASNDAVEAELGVTELAAQVEHDGGASETTRAAVAAAAKKVTEDRQLADAAKLAATATAARVDAQDASREGDPDGAAEAAATAQRAAVELSELVAQAETDQACSSATRSAIIAKADKAYEDSLAADASRFIAASDAARDQTEAAAKQADAAAAAEATARALDAESGANALVEQCNDGDKSVTEATKKVLVEAAAKTTNNRRLAEASNFAAQAAKARSEAEHAAESGDMYAAESAASDARTAESAALELGAQVKEDRSCSAVVKAAVGDAARHATDDRQIAEAAKCAAMSSSARKEAQRSCTEAAAPDCSAEQATTLAAAAGDSEETIEDALKQIQEILTKLRTDKQVAQNTKAAIAKYAQPIIEDRHLAEASKLAAQASAARAVVEEMCRGGELESVDEALKEFPAYEHDVRELKTHIDADASLSAATKQAIASAATTVSREKATAEAARQASNAEAAQHKAEHAASIADAEAAEAAAGVARQADDDAKAAVNSFEWSPGDDKQAHPVSLYAKRAEEARIIAEAAALSALAARSCEHTEAAATVADKARGEAAKSEAKRAAAQMDTLHRRVKGDKHLSEETKHAVAAFSDSCRANATAAAKIVVPDKAAESKRVVEKAAKFAAAAADARKRAEYQAKQRKIERAKEHVKECQHAASSVAALSEEVANSGLYDDSAKEQIEEHVTAAQVDARAAEDALENIPEEDPDANQPGLFGRAISGLVGGLLRSTSDVAEKAAEESAEADGVTAGRINATKDRKEGDEEKAEHFYGVTRSRFYMMPDSEEGVRLRDKAKASAQEVAKALADTRKAVKTLLEDAAHGEQRGADWKFAAANIAAAAVKRAHRASKEVERLAKEAQDRCESTGSTGNSTQKQKDRARGTSMVVSGFSDVAIADAKEADALFKSTHVVKPAKRRNSKNLTQASAYEKTDVSGTKSSATGDSRFASGKLGAIGGADDVDQTKMSSALADVLAAKTMQSRQASLMAALGLTNPDGGNGGAAGSPVSGASGSAVANLNLVMASFAFKVPDKENGMRLRDLAKSYAEQAAKALADAKEAVAIVLDPDSAAGHTDKSGRRNSSQQGASWKMHALNNAAAAVKRARVASTKAEALATQARERAESVSRDSPDNLQLINAANATAAVVIGFSDSAHSDANSSQEAFDSTSMFKRGRRAAPKPAPAT